MTNAPKPNLANIPQQLKALDVWRPWKFTAPKKPGDKPGKTPLSALTLKPSNNTTNTDDCTSFANLSAMLELEQKKPYSEQIFHGVGMSLTGANNLIVVDIDKALLPDESIKGYAQDVLNNIPGYVERSVSGTGFHIVTRTTDWDLGNVSDNDLGLEVFKNRRYIAITGDEEGKFSKPIPSEPVCTDSLKKYFNKTAPKDSFDYLKQPDPNWSIERIEKELLGALPSDLNYEQWIDVGMSLHFQSKASYEGFEAFDRFSLRGDNYPETGQQSTWDKWQSFGINPSRNLKSIGTLIKLIKDLEQARQFKSSSQEPLLAKVSDERHRIKKLDWLVDGMIKQGSLVMLGGEPSGGKTYVAIELLMSVASGKPFFDKHPTKQGHALYIACEGRDSVLRRITAWLNLKNGSADVDSAYISRQEVAILVPESSEISSESMADFITENSILPKVVVIDTMNYSLGTAKENDSNDMTEYFRRIANTMIRRFGCTVVLVHHTSKNGLDIRGSSVIRGALDSLFFVSRDATGQFKVKNDKHKDVENIPPFYLDYKEARFVLPDGTEDTNIALFMSSQKSSNSKINRLQQSCLDILESEVGIGGSMLKSEVLALMKYTNLSNVSRDVFKPLQDEGYILVKGKDVTLIRLDNSIDFTI